MMMRRPDDRRAGYKKGVSADDGRRRREETQLQIRKAKKEDRLSKRRNFSEVQKNPTSTETDKTLPTLADLPKIVDTLKDSSTSPKDRLEAVRSVRRMLSVEHNPPVDQILASGMLYHLICALLCDDDSMLQFEATWALTNIASTMHTNAVVEGGALPGLVRLLECPNAEVREQAAWCLGNIAGDCSEFRDMVLKTPAVPSLLKNIQSWDSLNLVGNVVWTISNLCRGKPKPEFSLVSPFMPALAHVITHPNSKAEMIVDATWAFSYLSDGDDNQIKEVLPVIPLMMPLLTSTKSSLILPALRTLGNIVTGQAEPTQAVLDAGLLEHASKLLQCSRKNVRKEMCWVLSNIAAGTKEQINLLLRTPDVMDLVAQYAQNAEWEIRKEAIWTVSNVFTGGDNRQVQSCVDCEGIEVLCEVLDMNDAGLVSIALDALEAMLKTGDARGRDYRSLIDECNGISKLENLQHHTNDKIYEKVVHIIDTYFGCDQDHEDENLAPATDGDNFVFGIPSKNLFGTGTSPDHRDTAQFDFGGSGYNFNA